MILVTGVDKVAKNRIVFAFIFTLCSFVNVSRSLAEKWVYSNAIDERFVKILVIFSN